MIFTCRKIQSCTHNQCWDMHILNYNSYCVLYTFYSSIACKNQNLKNFFRLLHIIDYLLLNQPKLDGNLLKMSIMYTIPMLRYEHFKL